MIKVLNEKYTLIYITIVNTICLTLYVAKLFSEKPRFDDIIIIILSFLSIACILSIINKKFLKLSYLYLCLVYLLQSFTIFFFNLAWKLIIGPDLSFYLMRDGDLTSKLDLKLFNLQFFYNTILNNNSWLIGINFIHLIIFYNLYKSTIITIKKTNNAA